MRDLVADLQRHPEAIILGWSSTPALCRGVLAKRLAESKCRKRAINFPLLADLDAFWPIESDLRYRTMPHMVRNETTMVECRTAIIKGASSEHETGYHSAGRPCCLNKADCLSWWGQPFRNKRPWRCASDRPLVGDRATASPRILGVVMAACVHVTKIA